MRSYLNAEELEALRGLPHEARTLYREGMRPYMDFDTGLVGVKRRLSYQMFYELLEVEAEAGSHRGAPVRPTLSSVRCLLDLLVRRGLIRRMKQASRAAPMVFRLCFADRSASFRPQEEQQRNSIEEQHAERHSDCGAETPEASGDEEDSEPENDTGSGIGLHPEEQHTSDYPIKNTITTAARNSIQLVADGRERVISDWSPSQQVLSDLAGFDVPLWFVQEYLAEFRLYWGGTGRRCQSWDAVLFKHCLRWWRSHGSKWRGAKGRGDDGFIARHFESSWANDLGGA